jgi:beta-lactamase regulating signal transducer with metallopeptidase domain
MAQALVDTVVNALGGTLGLPLQELATRWLPALADVTLKGSVLLALAGLATTWGMRRAAAATRHLVWSAAVVAVLALPVLSAVVPRWTAPVVPAALARAAAALRGEDGGASFRVERDAGSPALATRDDEAAVGGALHGASSTPRADAPVRVTVAPGTGAATPAGDRIGWVGAVFGIWAAGVAVVLLRLVLGTAGLARLVRRADPADDPSWVMSLQRLARELGIRRPVSLYVGRTGTVPVTWGVVYPIVLLPADAATWSEERRRAVLLHELAHVERLDALTQVLAQLAMAIFWFNPLVALAARRLRAERERACDDLVLAAGGVPATRYADDLLDLVRTLGEASPAAAALAMARRSEFEGRLLAILDPFAPRARTDRRRAGVAAVLGALAAIPLAGMRAATAASVHPTDPDIAEAIAPRPAIRTAPPAPHASGGTPAARPVSAPTAPAPARTGLVAPRAPSPLRAPPAPSITPSRTTMPDLGPVTRQLATVGARLPAAAVSVTDGCSRRRGEYVLGDDQPGTTYRIVDDTRCVELRAVGAVEFADDLSDVRGVPAGGLLLLVETPRGGPTRRMEIVSDDGRLVRRYSVTGEPRPLEEGQSWFRGTLGGVVRRSGIAASARIERLLREGGVTAVLAEAHRTPSDATRRKYLERVLAVPALDEAQLQQVAQATHAMTSDTDRGAVLRKLSARSGASAAVSGAVLDAARGITSSGERRRVLAQTPVTELPAAAIVDVANAVSAMTSDGDRAAVLLKLVPRAGETPAIRTAFFGAFNGMVTDSERRRVLLPTVERWNDDAMLASVLDVMRPMVSDSERGEVLRAVAGKRHLSSSPVRDRFFKLVGAFTSETERARVLLAALRADPTCVDTQRGVIDASTGFTSDTRRATVLLAVVRETNAMRDSTMRARLLGSMKGITSSSTYRQVMEALVP